MTTNRRRRFTNITSASGLLALLFINISSVFGAGVVTSINSQHEPISIKSHDVSVTVQNGFATTRVDQVFHNPNSEDLAAVYQFPMPRDAVSAEFTMWIDDKPVTAEVLEKEEARAIHEAEKEAGRNTGLTEKSLHQTFDISVYPVRASQDLKIRFVYIQSLELDHGVGRYVYPLENGGTDPQANAFWSGNSVVEESFSFKIDVKSGYPVEALRLPEHSFAQVTENTTNHWSAEIANGVTIEEETQTPDSQMPATLENDIVVYWRLQDGLPGRVDLVTYKPDAEDRGTFMMTLSPADDLTEIQEGLDWNFVLDISGSMQGKYSTLARGISQALGKLREEDRFRIVLFNDKERELTNGYVYATAENVKKYIAAVESTSPNGGTNVYAGLLNAINALDADRSSGIVLVTDGVANVGKTEFKDFKELLNARDVRLFSFVMGNGANNELIDYMTRISNGFSQSVSNADDIVGHILQASSKITHEAYHDIELAIDGLKVADMEPGTISSLYRGQQLVVFGHYWDGGTANVTFSGRVSGERKSYNTSFGFPSQSEQSPEIERLWAFYSIKLMIEEMKVLGYEEDTKQAIVDLSIEYGLVTDYTSMLIVEDERFDELGIDRNNKERLEAEAAAQENNSNLAGTGGTRVDQDQPAFGGSSADLGGGGALSPLAMMLVLLGLFVFRIIGDRARLCLHYRVGVIG